MKCGPLLPLTGTTGCNGSSRSYHGPQLLIPDSHEFLTLLQHRHGPEKMRKANPFDKICLDSLLLAFFKEEQPLLVQ